VRPRCARYNLSHLTYHPGQVSSAGTICIAA